MLPINWPFAPIQAGAHELRLCRYRRLLKRLVDRKRPTNYMVDLVVSLSDALFRTESVSCKPKACLEGPKGFSPVFQRRDPTFRNCPHKASLGLEVLKRRSIGQPDRPRTRYCSIGFQPLSSVHGTEARQAKPFVPTVKNARSSGLEVLKGPSFRGGNLLRLCFRRVSSRSLPSYTPFFPAIALFRALTRERDKVFRNVRHQYPETQSEKNRGDCYAYQQVRRNRSPACAIVTGQGSN